ncbi:MAG: metallophosphoesterase family protein [Phycisphaerae bacterium]|nr:metallophosphoesterase family protein [Phycisphaerae bacterium]
MHLSNRARRLSRPVRTGSILLLVLAASLTAAYSGCGILPPQQTLFRKGPYLLYTNDNTSMTVTWQTHDTPRAATIRWGRTPACCDGWAKVAETEPGQDGHQLFYTIASLAPDTHTYYKVTVDGQNCTGSFKTAPQESATSLTFYGYGDTRSDPNTHDAVVAKLLDDMNADPEHRQTFCLHGGDFTMDGMDEPFWDDEYFNRDYPDTQTFLQTLPILACVGNHETYRADFKPPAPEDMAKLFRKYWPLAFMPPGPPYYYSFDYGPLHVTVLDQYGGDYDAGSAQATWMAQDLAATDKPWKVVMFHHPAWSANGIPSHPDDNDHTIQTDLCPVFEATGVKLVVQGHEHYYARCESNGIQYLTLGGGGAPLSPPDPNYTNVVVAKEAYHFARFDIDGSQMNVTVIDIQGETIDAFQVTNN